MFWDGVVRRLGTEVPTFVVEAWLHPLVAETEETGESLRLLCPSALHLERVRDRFLPLIQKLVAEEAGRQLTIELEVSQGTASNGKAPQSDAPSKVSEPALPHKYPMTDRP